MLYTCRFCNYTSDDIEDFEEDFTQHKGYWCPMCDGFTYYDHRKDKQSYKLLLEVKSSNKSHEHSLFQKSKFPTQVSPLRWPGGKSKVLSQILSNCNRENMHSFVEPFAGGASVGLSLLLSGNTKELYLNDLDFGVYSLFATIKENPEYLINKIEQFTPSKDGYIVSQKVVKSKYKGCSISEAAWHLLVVNRLAFSGIPKANCMGNPAARWNANTLIKRVRNISRVSKHVHVSCMDACEFIEEMYWKPNTTILIDPPYVLKGKDLYMEYYKNEDHEKLAFLLDELYKGVPGADILITYDECQYLREIYDFPVFENLERQYCIAN